MLLVDAGDMLPAVMDMQGELKGEVLARAYGLMRYDAITLGETDLFFGPKYLDNLMSGYSLPIVSINVTAAAGDSTSPPSTTPTKTGIPPRGELVGRPLLEPGDDTGALTPRASVEAMRPYVIKEIAGVHIALVGMLNHRVLMPKSVTDSIGINPMEERLREILPEIEKRSDLIVALAHVGAVNRARALADSFPQLDVIIAAHVEVMPPFHEERNGVLLAYARNRGRFMGRLDLLLDDAGRIIGLGHDMAPMAPSIKDDPGVLRLLAGYIDRLKILVASTAFRPTLEDLSIPPSNYVTANACRACHPEQDAQWSRTTHAHAFNSIDKKQRDFDPDCQRCHTTGFRYRSGFITPRGTPHFKHVQCEACHGPGGDHVREQSGDKSETFSNEETVIAPSHELGDSSRIGEMGDAAPSNANESTEQLGRAERDAPSRYGAITESICLRCHTPHNSPEFEYEKYLKQVTH